MLVLAGVRVSFVNIARAASLRQSTATRDFRSLLESAGWPLARVSYCVVASEIIELQLGEQVGESSPYIAPYIGKRRARGFLLKRRKGGYRPRIDISRLPDVRNLRDEETHRGSSDNEQGGNHENER